MLSALKFGTQSFEVSNPILLIFNNLCIELENATFTNIFFT